MRLGDGSRVAVIGGGPAGSFFSFFLLETASRVGLDVHVDIYEPKRYDQPGPGGCNMCGGIISESLVQLLATEGINLPSNVVQRGIDSGEFRAVDAKQVAIATGAILEGTILLWVYDKSLVNPEQHIRTGIQLLLEGLQAPPARQA